MRGSPVATGPPVYSALEVNGVQEELESLVKVLVDPSGFGYRPVGIVGETVDGFGMAFVFLQSRGECHSDKTYITH
jgi:hypothetical protein